MIFTKIKLCRYVGDIRPALSDILAWQFMRSASSADVVVKLAETHFSNEEARIVR